MEPEEKTKLIRMFEAACKNYYKTRSKYETAKTICLEFNVLTEEQITELENHMKEQYS